MQRPEKFAHRHENAGLANFGLVFWLMACASLTVPLHGDLGGVANCRYKVLVNTWIAANKCVKFYLRP
jgi:hypothetical protein